MWVVVQHEKVGEVTNREDDALRVRSFDELTKALASATLSRRRALKLIGAGIVGGALGFFFDRRVGFAQQQAGESRCEPPTWYPFIREGPFGPSPHECLCERCVTAVPCEETTELGEGLCPQTLFACDFDTCRPTNLASPVGEVSQPAVASEGQVSADAVNQIASASR
jgi:hypothetical protein